MIAYIQSLRVCSALWQRCCLRAKGSFCSDIQDESEIAQGPMPVYLLHFICNRTDELCVSKNADVVKSGTVVSFKEDVPSCHEVFWIFPIPLLNALCELALYHLTAMNLPTRCSLSAGLFTGGKTLIDHVHQVWILQSCRHTLLVIQLLVDSFLSRVRSRRHLYVNLQAAKHWHVDQI